MITSFADATTQDIFDGTESKAARAVPKSIWAVPRRKLDLLNAAATLRDLRVDPSNRLEALKGDLKGKHSIRINDQFRVVFLWKSGAASNVQVLDYH